VDIRLSQSPDAFDLPEWRELHKVDPNHTIFSTPEWNRVWWEEFGNGKDLFVLTFLDPAPVGIAALMLDITDIGGRVRFVGGDDLTDYLGPVTAGEEHLAPIADALVRFIKEEIGGWGYFEARSMPVPFGFAERLIEAADRQGLGFFLIQDEVTAVLQLPDSFDAYLESLPQKKRHELRRKLRRFEREAPEASIRSSNAETLSADVEKFVEMHRGSEGRKGRFFGPERSTFFARVAETFYALDLLSLDFLEVDGERIASTFSFLFEDTLCLYNSAFQRDKGNLAPGMVLASRLIARAIDLGMKRFDFLRGGERYKFDLGAEPLPLHSVRLTKQRLTHGQ
jgi:CelD/BcsL family acetyltransferase involved in cellulose biosynthesis